jgi:hypothetical protein
MLIVPAVLAVNERLLAPPGASTPDQLSRVGDVVVDGDVTVDALLPQPAASATRHASEIRFMTLMGA